jgi:hypothetical protein
MPPRRPFPVHPLLFSAYPIITLLAINIAEVRVIEGLRPLVLSLAGATILLLAFKYWLSDFHRAALATSLALLVFFSYGHVYNAIENIRLLGFQPGRHRLLLPLWTALLLAGLCGLPALTGISAGYCALICTAVPRFLLAQMGLFGCRACRRQRTARSRKFNHLHLPAETARIFTI